MEAVSDRANPLGLAALAVEAALASLAVARLHIASRSTGAARPAAVASARPA